MAGQSRIVHRLHRRVGLEELRDGHGVFLVHAQARVERAQAAQGQEAVER